MKTPLDDISAREWSAFLSRTAAYGAISITLGPLTRRHDASRWAMHRWCVSCCEALGIERSIVGGDLIRSAPQCVLVANHLSLLDILILGAYLDRDYRWLAKDAIFRLPFIGWHLRLAGHVPVYRRGSKRARNRELPERIARVVADGASLLFFPEGTRSSDSRLRAFKRGAFVAAVDEGLPVLPLVIRGTDKLLAKGRARLAPQADRGCSVTVLPLVHAPEHGPSVERIEALRDATHAAFRQELEGIP